MADKDMTPSMQFGSNPRQTVS